MIFVDRNHDDDDGDDADDADGDDDDDDDDDESMDLGMLICRQTQMRKGDAP